MTIPYCRLILALCLLTNVTDAATQDKALERSRELLGFGQHVALNFPGGLEVDRGKRIVSLPASDKELLFDINMTGDTRPTFRRGKKITIRAEVLKGNGLGAAVCFIDAAGMEFTLVTSSSSPARTP